MDEAVQLGPRQIVIDQVMPTQRPERSARCHHPVGTGVRPATVSCRPQPSTGRGRRRRRPGRCDRRDAGLREELARMIVSGRAVPGRALLRGVTSRDIRSLAGC
jgi:hypothetical protein